MNARSAKGIFNHPVNYDEPFKPLFAEGYVSRIPFPPMDLSTVETHLKSNHYASEQEFSEEVGHIWQNAMAYNAPVHWVHEAALACQKIFTKEYDEIRKYKQQQTERKEARALRSAAARQYTDDDEDSSAEEEEEEQQEEQEEKGVDGHHRTPRRHSEDNISDYHSSIVSPASTPRKRTAKHTHTAGDNGSTDDSESDYAPRPYDATKSPVRKMGGSTSSSSLSRAELLARIKKLETAVAASASAASSTMDAANDDADFDARRHNASKRRKTNTISHSSRPNPASVQKKKTKQTNKRPQKRFRGDGQQFPGSADIHTLSNPQLPRAVYEQLRQDVMALPVERILNDIYPILSGNAAYQVCIKAGDDDEMEIDLDKLNADGVRELQAYLSRALQPPHKPPASVPTIIQPSRVPVLYPQTTVPALKYDSSSSESSTSDDDDNDAAIPNMVQ